MWVRLQPSMQEDGATSGHIVWSMISGTVSPVFGRCDPAWSVGRQGCWWDNRQLRLEPSTQMEWFLLCLQAGPWSMSLPPMVGVAFWTHHILVSGYMQILQVPTWILRFQQRNLFPWLVVKSVRRGGAKTEIFCSTASFSPMTLLFLDFDKGLKKYKYCLPKWILRLSWKFFK